MLKLVCLLPFLAYARGIVCPPNHCDTVFCAPVAASTCNGIIVKHGGLCGCCDTCRQVLCKHSFSIVKLESELDAFGPVKALREQPRTPKDSMYRPFT